MSHSFPAKRIIITGAGSGLGQAMALRFAAAGWRVAVTDIDPSRAAETLTQIKTGGGDGFSAGCDVRSVDDLRSIAARLEKEWSGVDVVINNAGVASGGTVIDTPLEDWDWVLDIDLKGVIRGCHIFAPLLVRQNAGHIVNIASFAGIAHPPAMASYNVAKTAVIGLSESLRAEMAEYQVGVSVVCPSFVETRLLESFRAPDPRLKTVAEKLLKSTNVTAADVADDVFNAVMKNRFMVITHKDARWLTRFKRLAPETFFKLLRSRAKALTRLA